MNPERSLGACGENWTTNSSSMTPTTFCWRRLLVNLTPKLCRMDEKPNPPENIMGTLRILVTGFEPFGTHQYNPSQEVALGIEGPHQLSIAGSETPINAEIISRVLTVDERGAIQTANSLASGESWDAILHIGLCDSCILPRVEQRAQQCLSMRIPDNSGRMLHEQHIDERGDTGCWIDISSWKKQDFSCDFELSYDAGLFVCNETYYHTLHALQLHSALQLPPPCLFLHIPPTEHLSVASASQFALDCIATMVLPSPNPIVEVVAGLVTNKQGQVLLAQRSDDHTWEFPGGKCEPNENWADAMERELLEELNVKVEANRILGTWEHLRNGSLLRIHLIDCSMSLGQPRADPSVHASLMWCDPLDHEGMNWTGRDGAMMEYITKYNSMPR
tara:strand:- start:17188 stop:18357 length:1170 start_codon:yes stop_codon:yes gene_type:complete